MSTLTEGSRDIQVDSQPGKRHRRIWRVLILLLFLAGLVVGMPVPPLGAIVSTALFDTTVPFHAHSGQPCSNAFGFSTAGRRPGK